MLKQKAFLKIIIKIKHFQIVKENIFGLEFGFFGLLGCHSAPNSA